MLNQFYFAEQKWCVDDSRCLKDFDFLAAGQGGIRIEGGSKTDGFGIWIG